MTTSYSFTRKSSSGFTLIELIVVMSLITILIAAGVVGIGRMDEAQKTNTALTLVEALTNEAKRNAIGKSTHVRLCILNDPSNRERHLRYVAIAIDVGENNTDGEYTPTWEIQTRGTLLPSGVFFDPQRSKINTNDLGTYGEGTDLLFPGGNNTPSNYYYYEFNSLGICIDSNAPEAKPGAALVIVGGTLPLNSNEPILRGEDKTGFIIWRNGSTALIRDPKHIQ